MKHNRKLKRINIEHAFYTYIVFNLINMVLHLIGLFTYPLLEQMDFGIYLLKIAIMLYICRLMFQKKEIFSLQIKLFKGIIALDAFELFISVFAYRYNQTYLIIAVAFILKAVLDTSIFTSLLFRGKTEAKDTFYTGIESRFKRYLTEWICVHLAILAGLIYIPFVFAKSKVAIFLLIFVLIRFAMQAFIIYLMWDYFYDNYELDESDKKEISSNIFQRLYKRLSSLPAAKKVRLCIYAIFFICFLLMRNYYIEGDQQLTDTDGNVLTNQKSVDRIYMVNSYPSEDEKRIYQYSKRNLMPSWSIFFHKKYGLINIDTADNTGAKYNDSLIFDKTGIAYDYDGHFINFSANEVMNVPYIVKARTSYRQEALNKLWQMIDEGKHYINNGVYYDVFGEFVWSSDHTYFANGVAQYHTYYNDRFGLIRDDGNLITLPKFNNGDGDHDFIVSTVLDYNRRNMYVINSAGEPISDINPYFVEYCDSANIVLINDEYLYSYDGRLIDEAHFTRKTGSFFIARFNRTDTTTGKVTLEVYYGDAKRILSSDRYADCMYCLDDNNELICVIAETKNGRYSLIDLDGNEIGSGNYIEIKYTAERDTFLGIDSDGRIDILHTDGRVIETDYILADKERDITDNIPVKKQDDRTQLYYIDIEGNLLEDGFTEDGK